MPSFLIVHSQPPGGRADRFAQPPTLEVAGLGARLDWGDTTFEVPPGDHRVTISVAPVAGGREGAVLTVRVLPETGTRISFSPPAQPGQPSTLRVDGQWPADAAMAYYAARDQRPLTPVAQAQAGADAAAAAPWGGPQASGGQAPSQASPGVAAPQRSPHPHPTPSVPPVGPSIGSTGSVPVVGPPPSSAPSFGQVQGAVVEPGAQQARPPAAPPTVPSAAPTWAQPSPFAPPAQQGVPPQSGSQQPQQAPPSAGPQGGWQPAAPLGAGPGQPSVQPQPQPQPPVVPMRTAGQHAPGPQQPWQAGGAAATAQPGVDAPAFAQRPGPRVPPPQVGPPPASGAPSAFGPGAPAHPPMGTEGQPAFGHQPVVRRDVYGRDRVDGDRTAPAIPTPREFEDFARAERDRHEAERAAASRQPQGWYPDPWGRSDVRWHDGERWTPSVMRGGRREHDPV
ncbi:DUF2510 domain-containing protein [Agrococcus sp. SGAir0287]|uniref:DUF2510 domain-containing protein n=1 Tax=Agrococcus sp. SGAir0287 TaxID=2070347 RepID=UPI0010F87BBF|nr:DUF2510 domain-containing protein [Agrococcus sp. SGAir0287]